MKRKDMKVGKEYAVRDYAGHASRAVLVDAGRWERPVWRAQPNTVFDPTIGTTERVYAHRSKTGAHVLVRFRSSRYGRLTAVSAATVLSEWEEYEAQQRAALAERQRRSEELAAARASLVRDAEGRASTIIGALEALGLGDLLDSARPCGSMDSLSVHVVHSGPTIGAVEVSERVALVLAEAVLGANGSGNTPRRN